MSSVRPQTRLRYALRDDSEGEGKGLPFASDDAPRGAPVAGETPLDGPYGPWDYQLRAELHTELPLPTLVGLAARTFSS